MSDDATLDKFTNDNEPSELPFESSSVESSLDETSAGGVPDEWNLVRLRELTENTLYGANESAEDYDPQKPRYIRIKDIDEQGRLKKEEKASLSPDKAEGYYLERGDMLFARSGSPGRTYLHRKKDDQYCYGGYSIKHQLISHGLNHEYLSQYTKSSKYWDWIERIARTGAQANINSKEYASLLVPLPTLSEQRKIATVLHTVDQAIQKTEEIIGQKKKLKFGLYQSLFSGGIQSHSRSKSSKYGKIPDSWEVSRLGEVTSQMQAGGTPDTDVEEYYGGSIPWVKTGELSQHHVTETEQNITERGLEESTARLLPAKTVLIAMYGATTGEVSILGIEASTNQACCGIIPTDKLLPEFLYHQLDYLSDHLESLSAGSGQQNISKGIIKKFDILLPAVDEQESIVNILNNVDKSIKNNKSTKEQYQRLKQGLMRDLLSGEVRTTDANTDVAEEVAKYG
jgi:type I restriction enzyme S subunit